MIPPASQPQQHSSERFLVLEAIRGLCAIMVAMRHSPGLNFEAETATSFLAVDMFFLLSGFVIAHAYEQSLRDGRLTFLKFCRVRLRRLYPLFLLGLVLALCAEQVLNWFTTAQVVFALPFALLMFPAPVVEYPFMMNPPRWSLFFELVANFVFAAAPRALNSIVLAAIVFVALTLFAFESFTDPRAANLGWERSSLIFGFARVAISFPIGVILYRAFKPRCHEVRFGTVAMLICILALILSLNIHGLANPALAAFCLVAIALIFPAIVWISAGVELAKPLRIPFLLLGQLSYPLYIVHLPIIDAVYRLIDGAPRLLIDRYVPFFPWILLLGLCGLALALHKYFDVPVRTWLGKGAFAPQSRA